VRKGIKLTNMTASSALPIVPPAFKFARRGQSGAWVSELLPHTAKVVDDICFIKSLFSEQINHEPATTYQLTGFHLPGRPTMGAWVSYALGSENQNLPAYVAVPTGTTSINFLERYWGSGWLPPRYGGVKFRSGPDPVLYLSNPKGFAPEDRRGFLDDLA